MIAKIHGAAIYYDVHGTGAPVLLLHGFPLSGQLWAPTVTALQDRYKFIVPDVRGLGRSTGYEDVSMTRWADDIIWLLEAIGETRPIVLVGMSMGGYIAFEFYRRHHDHLRGLVLVDTHPKADTPEKLEDRRCMADRVLKEGSQVVADGMSEILFGSDASDDLRATWHAIMADTPPEGVAAALRAMAERPDSTPTLAGIEVPTLVIGGTQDVITPPDGMREMAEALPKARLELVPDSGHMLPVERPDRFAERLRAFLDGLG